MKEKLLKIQQELRAPKSRTNDYAKFNYRSTEDILTALKPLLEKHNVLLTIDDSIEMIGDRYYVKATAKLVDIDDGSMVITVPAYARETLSRTKYDESQLTGAASSYARKYALNGLFLIDDSHDADSYEEEPEESKADPDPDFMHIPEDAPEAVPFEEEDDEKPKPRRRRKRT